MQKLLAMLIFAAACQGAGSPTSQAATPELSLGDNPQITLAAGNNNDYFYDNETTQEMVTASGGSTVTGLDYTGFYGGDTIIIRNAGTAPLTLASDSGLSMGVNQFHFPGGKDVVLQRGDAMWIQDDADDLGGWWPVGPVESGMPTITTPSRTLGTAFQPSTTKNTLVHYTVSITTALTVSGGQSGRVDLWVGPTSSLSSSNSVAAVSSALTGTVVIGVAMGQVGGGELSYEVPRGYWAELSTTNVTGSPTYAITEQSEETLN